jgi:hypothetical protein
MKEVEKLIAAMETRKKSLGETIWKEKGRLEEIEDILSSLRSAVEADAVREQIDKKGRE